MSFGEILIVCFGLTLDVFSVAACMGAMLARIRTGRLIIRCLIFSLWQVIAFVLGRLLSVLLRPDGVSAVTLGIWRIVSAGIFLALGGLLIGKALKNKIIFEHRSEFPIKKVMAAGALLSIDAFFAGVGFGLLNARWLTTGVTLFAVSVLCACGGILTGYHFGYEQKTKAYWVGGALFLAAGVDVIARALA